MTGFFWLLIGLFTLLLVGGLVRVAVGPTLSDRISGTMLLGTTGTAVLLLLHVVLDAPALVDAALVLVLLAVIAAAAFSRFTSAPDERTAIGASD